MESVVSKWRFGFSCRFCFYVKVIWAWGRQFLLQVGNLWEPWCLYYYGHIIKFLNRLSTLLIDKIKIEQSIILSGFFDWGTEPILPTSQVNLDTKKKIWSCSQGRNWESFHWKNEILAVRIMTLLIHGTYIIHLFHSGSC